ncbi:MAG: type II secretion system F family protein [Elusimicrobia bacterium]|nr:type II secretion system F family protein [Elusimicrobiota bacterium]
MRAIASAVVLLSLAAPPAGAQLFKPAEVKFMLDKEGAETRAQKFYHYFKRDRDPSLPVPEWVDKNLEAMLKRPVWQDPEEGVLNEAQLWQAPASVLYEFFELTRKTLGPSDGGQLMSPYALVRDFEDNRVRFQMSLDRLYRARLGSSLGGRGRAVMASFDLIVKEMDSLLDALVSGDVQRYREATLAIAALTNSAFYAVNAPPRGYSPPEDGKRGSLALPYLIKLIGVAFIFAAGWLVGTLNEDKITQAWEKYKVKAKEWAHEYERQFLTVKINHIVGAPIVLGFLIGLLTFDPFGMLIFMFFGLYAGLILPGWLLRNIRFRRGMKCEAQLMDAMILMSNGLKSGIDLVQCVDLVQRDLQPPISEEFGLVLKNYQLGTSIDKALEGMEERVQSRLLSYMIKAVVIQRTAGGNLTKIFDRIVENIREESKLVEKTAALTAQQKIQSIVVGIMPWVMLIIMFVFQPGPMRDFYFSWLGVMVLVFCTIWIAIGMKIVNKLGDIHV